MHKSAALSIFILAAGITFIIIGIDDPLIATFGFVLAGFGAIFVFVWVGGMIYGKKEERKEKERSRFDNLEQSLVGNGADGIKYVLYVVAIAIWRQSLFSARTFERSLA